MDWISIKDRLPNEGEEIQSRLAKPLREGIEKFAKEIVMGALLTTLWSLNNISNNLTNDKSFKTPQ